MSVPGLRREDFPAFDRFTYLNTASAGLVPAAVLQPAHEFEAELAQAALDSSIRCRILVLWV